MPGASARRYGQYCPVARSLDVLGERWTLLVVRNLMMGPLRYSDLRDALPGVATDLLTSRLRTLEAADYVHRRRLPRPSSATVYELTESGQRLALVVLELARVGLMHLGAPGDDEEVVADSVVLSLRASFRAEVAGDAQERYQLELDGERFAVTVHLGWAETARGPADQPRLTLTSSARTFARLISRDVDLASALADGEVELAGRKRDAERFLKIFSYPGSPAALTS